MNQRIISIFLVAVGIMLGLYVMLSVLTGGGNEIGRLAIYVSCGCFLIALIAPKPSMYLLLFLAGYSDLLKRFMILGSSLSQLDLVYVLAIAPVTLAGAALSLVVSRLIRGEVRRPELIRFALCTMVLILVAVSALRGDGGMKAMRGVVDYGAFIYLFYVLPILFPDRDGLLKFVKTALYIFIPVAIYGIWQRVFGLSAFELDYLATGLSSESRQFDEIKFRPFSTLNAASSLTIVAAACVMLSYILMRAKMLNKFQGVLLIALFTASCIMTFTRTGWLCLALAPVIVMIYRFKLTTILSYLGAIMLFLTLVVYSDWFLSNLQRWQTEITGVDDFGRSAQALKITTLSDRFVGFQNLKNPKNWTLFGVEDVDYYGVGRKESSVFSHDMITRFIFKRGFVPFFLFLGLGLIMITKLHKKIFAQPKLQRRFSTLVIGCCSALLASVLTGGYLFQFPANIFFWIMVCIALNCLAEGEDEPYQELLNE